MAAAMDIVRAEAEAQVAFPLGSTSAAAGGAAEGGAAATALGAGILAAAGRASEDALRILSTLLVPADLQASHTSQLAPPALAALAAAYGSDVLPAPGSSPASPGSRGGGGVNGADDDGSITFREWLDLPSTEEWIAASLLAAPSAILRARVGSFLLQAALQSGCASCLARTLFALLPRTAQAPTRCSDFFCVLQRCLDDALDETQRQEQAQEEEGQQEAGQQQAQGDADPLADAINGIEVDDAFAIAARLLCAVSAAISCSSWPACHPA